MQIDMQQVSDRLDEISHIEAGWYNGEGEAVDLRAIAAAKAMFAIIGTAGYEALAPTVEQDRRYIDIGSASGDVIIHLSENDQN